MISDAAPPGGANNVPDWRSLGELAVALSVDLVERLLMTDDEM